MEAMTEKIKMLFLRIAGDALAGRPTEITEELSTEEWQAFFHLSDHHQILPMVFDQLCQMNHFPETAKPLYQFMKRQTFHSLVAQVRKTERFTELYRTLEENGLRPVVVKGLICRSLYPNPDLRFSNDEDLYVPSVDFPDYSRVILDFGLNPDTAEDEGGEACFADTTSPLIIEVHRDLMDMELGVIADMNQLFDGAFDRTVDVEIDGCSFRTLDPTDHMLFLILHAFKHFVVGGFGIRQVMDMRMFASHYGEAIDFTQVLNKAKSFRADQFTLALFDICHRYFDFDYENAHFPEKLLNTKLDSKDLLEDLLDAGVYGGSSLSRRHSSGVTMNTLQSQYEGKSTGKGSGLMKSLFPSARSLSERHPYLVKYPFLLPVAWTKRIVSYIGEIGNSRKNDSNAIEALKIGNERVELMKEYGILHETGKK